MNSPTVNPDPGHGEYKIPGGKLVVVDLQVVDGCLSKVRLSGDFFLEPPETLDAINAALEGLPADADAARLTRAVNDVLGTDVQMFGLTPEGIAVVIQRAL
ncbi:MAG: biotin--protein ligase [Castellaniella sp.]|uniref:biotin--protein ligase n=1 Tax=Castellaniella sp. TaxID=1955812 RepID=UPI003C719A49